MAPLPHQSPSPRWGWFIFFLLPLLPAVPWPARADIQLRCDGTLLEARGSAEQQQPIGQLRFTLGLEAEQRSSDAALALLQERLAKVRAALQGLEVKDFRATSPSTWERPAETGRSPITQASLQVSGLLAPSRLQPLVRQVGALPGVRLAPVSPEADLELSAKSRRALLATAYRQAFHRAEDVAAALGLSRLQPLEVQVEDDRPPVVARVAMAAKADVPPFDPGELVPPKNSASMLVRFCAR
ncbi:MAG: SIMPL domain-containing protein [Cyanobium sp.]